MFGRFLVWIVVAIAAWWLLRPRRRVAPPPGTGAQAPGGPAAPAPEAMVDCADCGLHFPASEAVRDGARAFCCSAHRDAGPRGGE
jgi:uncharacterized protein